MATQSISNTKTASGTVDSVWLKSYDWDAAQCNTIALYENDPEIDRIMEAFDLYQEKQHDAALALWRELAEQGSVCVMSLLGERYEAGEGVEADAAEAERWYTRAWEGGSQYAMLKCAKKAAARKDYKRCEEILQPGVDQDWVPAIFWMAWYRHEQSESKETYRAIRPMLEDAAKRGHPAARMVLANFMSKGKFGLLSIPRGFKQAIAAGFGAVYEPQMPNAH